MTRRARSLRRGSALILVLMMTLAVAGLSIAAIFLSSSAGLLARYYDRERDFRYAADAALATVRSRLVRDTLLAIPDTGMVQLLAGSQLLDAAGLPVSGVRVNVYAAATGDTSGLLVPHITLIAASYDVNGTRHVRRADLERESYSRYALMADRFGSTLTFGPGTVFGRVHTNETWRTGTGTSAATYLDTVTAMVDTTGTGTYTGGAVTDVPVLHFPRDSTFPRIATLAAAANLSFAPVSGSGAGWVKGSRLEFVTVDADNDSVSDADEGFARVFDLADNMDTTYINVGMAAETWYIFYYARAWSHRQVQNQCGAFYYRNSRWNFFPVATHRAAWAQAIIQATGGSNFPAVTLPTMGAMDDSTYSSASTILTQSTARCFPAGSPYLVATERLTNEFGVVTGGAADTIPFGVVSLPTYGGSDTTFTPRSRTCGIAANGHCSAGTVATLGTWRLFGGTALSGVPTTVRQAAELPYLWPYSPARNATSRRVIYSSGGLFVSGSVRGRVTLQVNGDAQVISSLEYAQDPADSETTPCENQLGLLASGDVLLADNALTRGKRIGGTIFASTSKHLGGARELVLHGNLMSLQGTVGVVNNGSTGIVPQSCPADATTNTSGGCLRITGGMAMRTYSPLQSGSNTGFRYLGMRDPCQTTSNRPPFFPLTNRHRVIRTLEVEPSLANTPAKIRTLLLRLKGKSL